MSRIHTRLFAAITTLACAALLGVSAWLSPAREGHGTHTQLGMPPCAWAVSLDAPCATCGMTTAFAHAAKGDLVASAKTQPFGMLLAITTATVFWAGLYQTLTGVRMNAVFDRILRGKTLIVIGVLFLAAWGYKLLSWNGIAL